MPDGLNDNEKEPSFFPIVSDMYTTYTLLITPEYYCFLKMQVLNLYQNIQKILQSADLLGHRSRVVSLRTENTEKNHFNKDIYMSHL